MKLDASNILDAVAVVCRLEGDLLKSGLSQRAVTPIRFR